MKNWSIFSYLNCSLYIQAFNLMPIILDTYKEMSGLVYMCMLSIKEEQISPLPLPLSSHEALLRVSLDSEFFFLIQCGIFSPIVY